ncbi:hypothetical protein AB0N29_05545 [Nocardioides sp. NPDC092400]|uniref:hypothetical protein n=1 Tax=Nocardioides sp. NPDC092400 TaxID=3155196 RepID=UPI003444F511
MTPRRRWSIVAASAVLLAVAPLAPRALPASESGVDAGTLLGRVQDSADEGWSGYVETAGTLQLPEADRFDDVGALVGEPARMRAWWADRDRWRVDRLLVAGEVDLVHADGRTTTFDYERARATVGTDPDIRLPRSADLVPPELARRLLAGVDAADVTRIGARRVAGTSAAGLRVEPASELSSVDHVDLWAEPRTGVALRVEVHDTARGGPAFTTGFADFSGGPPDEAEVSFRPTPGVEVRTEDVLDIADAANQYAPLRPPAEVAGLARSGASDGAVGVYGEGLTRLIAIPLRDSEADALREQLVVTPGAVRTPTHTAAALGPLSVHLTGGEGDGGWLLAGTVTPAGLQQAADDLVAGTVYVGEDR